MSRYGIHVSAALEPLDRFHFICNSIHEMGSMSTSTSLICYSKPLECASMRTQWPFILLSSSQSTASLLCCYLAEEIKWYLK